MKRLHRTVAGFLAAVMLASPVWAVSWNWQSSTNLGGTVALSAGQYQSNGNQTEYVLEVGPDDGLTPQVYYGNTMYGRSTMDTLANQLTAQGITPVAAVNGSFFELSSGMPYGVVITDGVLRSSGSGTAVGFLDDGSTIIGSPSLSYTVTTPGGMTMTPHVNRISNKSSGMVLFTRDFDSSTRTTTKTYNVVLEPAETDLKLGDSTKAKVVDIVPATASLTIPQGAWVLAMTLDTDYQYTLTSQLQTLEIGDTVTVKSTVTKGWENVQYACGGDDMLVQNGKALTDFKLDSAKRQTGRTAVGIKANGDMVLYTVDGLRSSYSAGMTLEELADRMVELGCVTALNLDGGGSTTMGGRYLGTDDLVTLNKPSDGQQRKCANFIFLTRETTSPGKATALHLYPYDGAVLGGASLSLEVLASDKNEMVAKVPNDLIYTTTTGIVGSSGSFTAGNQAGTATVTARSGLVTGSVDIQVITDPTDITIKAEGTGATKISLGSGQSVNLTATASYRGKGLVAQDHNFRWSVPASLGTIDENGLFQAVETTENISGNITVTAGSCKKTIPVTIARKPLEGAVIADFEGNGFSGDDHAMKATLNTNRAYLQYGKGSGKLTYDVSTSTTATASFDAFTSGGTLGLWVYGDNSNNSLSAKFLADGQLTSLWLTQLNFSGWKWIAATMPANTSMVTGLYVTAYPQATTATGTIYVDQMTATPTPVTDTTAPTITLTNNGTQVEAKATDSDSGLSNLTLYVDGVAQSKTTWAVPQTNATYQVRAVAKDNFGNLSSKSLTIAGTAVSPFADMAGHWASPFVTYAYDQGYLNGSADTTGNLLFRPNDTMTRQEFAMALMGFLDVDIIHYQNVVLPYRDKSQVAFWAENAVKAAYELGFMTGSTVNGKLYGQPTAPITRQEVMVILARTQDKGYGTVALSQFADQGKIAIWAQGDIATMVAQGVIQGSEGNLNPLGNVTRSQVAKMLQSLR